MAFLFPCRGHGSFKDYQSKQSILNMQFIQITRTRGSNYITPEIYPSLALSELGRRRKLKAKILNPSSARKMPTR